ncbi:serine-rich adhesin for platelets-like isoform X2 [Odontomachus brunneus]|uniref:serine-rich adhesin for platelets-like isoform X2 n=1 Tax=Odontomachus brunneus TaxID=486640 RepID=UPI0013F1F44F|nr:serine-rich adhesin for platelets-like isoform X2 [Odontomachus brunneus]
MEALLPSEIARLVLGYLEDQQCTEAAKLFLESSPHLQECRTVVSCGKRFSTKVNGLTLMDVIEKFSAISTMIQERLNKATDCEQLKHCGDLIEQLKFLVEEPRGQRFVVNINVPSQNNSQASNGSPILANNMRRRRHSNSERNKRPVKSQSNTAQQPDVLTTSPISHNVDTTPLESLPGNINMFKQAESSNRTEKRDDNIAHESLGQYDFEKNDGMWNTQHFETDFNGKKKEIANIMTSTPSLKRCTTATNTEELLQFSSAEVQTTPYEIPESESESNDEPIENLSILTKEILNRTELQECIAENINRAIIPTDLSLRDECFNESIGEGNTSIMAELNNAIKSIVEATETDPVFEKFLDEIIGPHTETDTSPEEDGEGKHSPKFLNEVEQEKHVEATFGNVSSPEPTIVDTRTSAENNAADVPLKHRLRSSSRQQNNRIEDEAEKSKDQEKEQSSLEDQNAAAVLSIVNANITNNTSNEKKIVDNVKESTVAGEITEENVQMMISAAVSKEDTTTKSLTSSNIQRMSNVVPSANGNTESKVKKSTVKRPRPTKPKRDQTINDNQIMTKQEMMTTPTLVVCSKEEISNLLSMNHSSTIRSTSTSRFIPIAPKDPSRIAGSLETMYLRTVNLAQKLPILVDEPGNSGQALSQSQRSTTKRPLIPTEPMQMIGKLAAGESQVITLYGNESSAKTSLDSANMPTINLEENISLSESGLSPYVKFNCSKIGQSHNLSDIDLTPVMENVKCTATTTMTIDATTAEQQPTVSTNTDIITKRTPKSLLKSRSKNRRLSLSTPRKRSSHIRALDFSTPPKVISSARKANANETTKRLKSVCRTSLFKSPSFSNSSAMTTQKQQSPVKICQSYKIPIATRSPAPKLMGGWDKFNGVGVIIGDVSSHGSTSASSSSEDRAQHKTSKMPAEIWDADLRKCLQSNKKDETEVKKPTKRKHSNKDGNSVTHKRGKYNQQSTKSKDKRKSCETSQKTEDTNEPCEHSQENAKTTTIEKNHDVITTSASNISTSKFDKISGSGDASETSTKTDAISTPDNDAVAEKKPLKKYVQLKTIRTNLKKPNDDESKNNTEDASQVVNRSQMSELSRILSSTSTQHMLQIPDMIDVETPRKFNNDGTSMLPPTPRMLSPGNNAVTPFIKLSEDSSRLRSSFISTPEFPITPCISLTPKHTEETTRDVVKENEYRSPYYEPSCEQATEEKNGISKNIPVVSVESPVISSSHIKLQSTHNSLAAAGTSYQTCTSTTKLEITQFEVIKENLPKEEAIKELKIASNNKDSTMELNTVTSSASVVAVDLIRINELPNTNVEHHHQTLISDHNYSNESDSSSSSDISSSSDSSSSSSSTSTTNSSSSCSSNDKSNHSPTKNLNAHEDTDAVEKNNENNSNINPVIVEESSPRKVFAIEKTDDQLQATPQETPAKDETLLNEADISETPSSSKSGIENLTNLSTKISAIITADEKLSKLTKSQDNSNKNFSRARSKPKVTNVQCIRPESSKAAIEEFVKAAAGDSHAHQPTICNKLIMHLQEKRERVAAKFRDAPKSNIASGTTRKRMLMRKASNDARNKNAQFTKLNRRQAAPSKHPQGNRDRDKPATVPPPQIVLQESNPAKNTRKRCELQKQSSASGCGDHDEEKRKQMSTSRNVNLSPTTTSHVTIGRLHNDSEMKQTHMSNVGNANSLENFNNIETESAAKSSLEERDRSKERDCSKERSNAKENAERSCDVNTASREEVRKTLGDGNTHTKVLEKETKSTERHVVAQETLISEDKAKPESRDHVENRASKSRQFASHIDKAKCILKCKVDQVKRDLFSDEENDQRVSSCVATSQREKAHKTTEETQQSSAPMKEVSSLSQENIHVENPKEELSSVLQCLQLVPAHKNENELGQNEKQQQQLNEDKNKLEETNEDDGNKSDQKKATVPNYKAEYHFVYDDSAPVRKRRRRYSGHELQIEINHADLSDPNPVECITVLKATEFEEIFNLQPKNSKKRTLSKKTLHKSETFATKTDNEAIISRDNTKLLAASSSMDEMSGAKAKKSIKTASRTGNDAQIDLKKKSKPDKTQEKVLETATKSRKRKLSETKETKQIEKSCATDPQTLLSNVDLNKFLTTVHGPE